MSDKQQQELNDLTSNILSTYYVLKYKIKNVTVENKLVKLSWVNGATTAMQMQCSEDARKFELLWMQIYESS